jgi:polygalacturonase
VLSPLFVFYSPKTPVPEKCDYYFAPGEHDVGIVHLTAGQTVYVEEGAVVYGAFHAAGADGVSILGEGVISGEKLHREKLSLETPILLDFIRSNNIFVGAVTLYDGPGWHCRTVECEHAEIDGLREISMNPSGDGIDICNSCHVHIRNCFICRLYSNSQTTSLSGAENVPK